MGTENESKKTENATINTGEKKPEVLRDEEVVAGAKVESERRLAGHNHPLMQLKLNLLEVNHRTIEKIEKQRFIIMNKYDGDEAINMFKDFVFDKLISEE